MPEASPRGTHLQVSESLLRAAGVRMGDHYPTENWLYDRFGASRTSVQSAIPQLDEQRQLSKGATRGRVILAPPVAQEGQTA